MNEQEHGYGFKLLDPTSATYPARRDGSKEMVYTLPDPCEKWGPWMMHPRPATPNGEPCGAGRFHVHRWLSYQFSPPRAWPWFAEWYGVVGGDRDKVGVREIRLRRIAPKVLWRALRPPFNWGRGGLLAGADFSWANLRRADLSQANLRGANLRRADLCGANLYEADLGGADLREAKLHRADLRGANLRRADLSGVDLGAAATEGALGLEGRDDVQHDGS